VQGAAVASGRWWCKGAPCTHRRHSPPTLTADMIEMAVAQKDVGHVACALRTPPYVEGDLELGHNDTGLLHAQQGVACECAHSLCSTRSGPGMALLRPERIQQRGCTPSLTCPLMETPDSSMPPTLSTAALVSDITPGADMAAAAREPGPGPAASAFAGLWPLLLAGPAAWPRLLPLVVGPDVGASWDPPGGAAVAPIVSASTRCSDVSMTGGG
jgi:hypothetical protein